MPARKKSRRPAKKSSHGKAAPKRKAAPRKAAKKAAKKRPAKPKRAGSRAKPAPAMPKAPANAIGLVMHHIDYTTHNPDAVRRFYVETLGFTDADHDPQFQYLFVRTGHSSSVGFMPPMPGMGEPSPAKEPTLYFIVSDVDKAYATLAARGVHFEGPPADMPWGHRVVGTVDPEGRRVLLATPKPKNS